MKILKILFPKCWDCKKTIWAWQTPGIDGISHESCHKERRNKLISEWPHLKDYIENL